MGRGWGRLFELQDPQHARLLPMEGLRGIAVTLVFLQHYCEQAQELGLAPGPASAVAAAFRTYGNYGVELFFVLSGYLIYGTLVRKAPPFLQFMARRYQRIYPTFLVIFVPALLLTIQFQSSRIPSDPWQATIYLAANAGLVAGLVPMVRIVDVAWSLSYEMFFYIVTAAFVLGTGFSSLARHQRVAILIALSVGFVFAAQLQFPNMPFRMMPFFAGMLLAEGVGQRVPAWLAWFAPIVAFGLAVSHTLSSVTQELVQSIAFFALCAACFRGVGRVSAVNSWAPLRWLGNMSYSFYLIHGFVVRAAMLALGTMLPHGMPDWMFWSVMPCLYGAASLASAALFLMVEKPFSLRPSAPLAPAFSG